MVKYIFFDVSGTLLGKPILFFKINEVLLSHKYVVDLNELKFKHKLLSEVIHFPDRTDEHFYNYFNAELLRLLGIMPSESLLKAIFTNCTYLPWEKFDDTNTLTEIKVPMGIISNFNSTLKDKLNQFFGPVFKDVLVSEELGVAKPAIAFYESALERLQFKPSEVLYVGDSLKLDIEPASSLGIKSLLIDRDDFYSSSPFKIKSLVEIKKYL
jgi:HAD superfamily hydrolase (TIGR01509 family)